MAGVRGGSAKVKLSKELLRRVDVAAAAAGMVRREVIENAVSRELRRIEIEMVRDEITRLEIGRRVLAAGQTLAADAELDSAGPSQAEPLRCELCTEEIAAANLKVDGPLFCRECLAIAKGGDFRMFEQDP